MDHLDYRETVKRITEADVVFNTIVPPGVTLPFQGIPQLRIPGAADTWSAPCFLDETPPQHGAGPHVEGLRGCLDYYEGRQPTFGFCGRSCWRR